MFYNCVVVFYREKKKETEREELWKRLGQLEISSTGRGKPSAASLISVDNNNKTSSNNSLDTVQTAVTTATAPIAAAPIASSPIAASPIAAQQQ